jgi:hypothetical protein
VCSPIFFFFTKGFLYFFASFLTLAPNLPNAFPAVKAQTDTKKTNNNRSLEHVKQWGKVVSK